VVEIPPGFLPKLRISSFTGLVDTVRAVTKAMRGVVKGYDKLLWHQVEEDFWLAYASGDLPAIVEKRRGIPAHARSKQKWRPVK
jgi:hypothetical protein